MRIRCPWCGDRDHDEFAYGGDAKMVRPPEPGALSDIDWHAYVYSRANPRGPHEELWQHLAGCRAWLKVRRDTVTHQVLATGGPRDDLADGTA